MSAEKFCAKSMVARTVESIGKSLDQEFRELQTAIEKAADANKFSVTVKKMFSGNLMALRELGFEVVDVLSRNEHDHWLIRWDTTDEGSKSSAELSNDVKIV